MKRLGALIVTIIFIAITAIPVSAAPGIDPLGVKNEVYQAIEDIRAAHGNPTSYLVFLTLDNESKLEKVRLLYIGKYAILAEKNIATGTLATIFQNDDTRTIGSVGISRIDIYGNGYVNITMVLGGLGRGISPGVLISDVSTMSTSKFPASYFNSNQDYKIGPNIPSGVDIKELVELMARATALNRSMYIETSLTKMDFIVSESNELLLDKTITQNRVDELCVRFAELLDQMVLKADMTELQEMLIEAEQIENDGYTNSSWNALQSAIIDGNMIVNSDESTKNQVINGITILSNAMTSLKYALSGALDGNVLGSLADIIMLYVKVLVPMGVTFLCLLMAINLIPLIIKRLTRS